MCVVPCSIQVWCWIARLGGPGRYRYTVNRARRDAKLAASAKIGYHGVRLPAGADDRIYGAGRETLDAPDAAFFVDHCNQRWTLDAIVRVERHRLTMKQIR
jgi:hypothetical protein